MPGTMRTLSLAYKPLEYKCNKSSVVSLGPKSVRMLSICLRRSVLTAMSSGFMELLYGISVLAVGCCPSFACPMAAEEKDEKAPSC